MNNYYLKYKGPIAAILVLTVIGGVYSGTKIKTGLFPDITFPKIKIIAENGEQPVDKMMVTVTVPLENAIKRVEELKMLRSVTSRGSCEISAFLNWGADVDLGKQRVEAQIGAIKQDLPPGVDIVVEKMNPSILPVMGYSLEGEGRSPIELRKLAEFTVKPILSRVQGVSEVAVIGGKVKEYHILLDLMKMSDLRVTPQMVADVFSRSNFVSSNGFSSDYNRLYLTLTDATIGAKDELANTVIVNSPKNKIRLEDIAQVEIAERRDYVKINANGKDVPLIAIVKQPRANLLEVTNAVKDQLTEVQRVLPAGVTLRPFYDQGDFVRGAINSLRDVLWIGLLLAMFVTVLFLRSLKASSVILVTIPVTLCLTLVILHALNYTFDIMTIGAIAAAVGLIIDDAIVVVEQIHRSWEEHPDAKSSELAAGAVRFLFPAMIGSSLSTIVIFLPFVLMGGVAGAYFRVLTDTMIITLVCSFFVTWIGLPVIYILFSTKPHGPAREPRVPKDRPWVRYLVRRPFFAGAFAAMLIAFAVVILPRLPSGFLPEMDEGSIVLDYLSPPGSSLEATDRMLRVVDQVLQETPEVESFSRRTGTQLGFFITEANNGDYLIQLKNGRKRTTNEVANDIRARVETLVPALQVDFGQVIGDMLGDLMASVQPIEVKIFGDNHKKLTALADSVAAVVESTRGTADVFNGVVIAGPEVRFEPRTADLAQYQLTPSDLQFQLQTRIEGSVVGGILEDNQIVDIRMMEERKNAPIDALRHGLIFLNDGRLKPMDEFADVVLTGGVAEIDRENLKPMVAVTGRLENRDLGSTLKDIQTRVKHRIALPPGYQIVYGGAYAEQQQAFGELLSILIFAVLLVFIVILFLFRSFTACVTIVSIAVLGCAGSLLALFVTRTPLNVGSYTGIIMIVGIIAENAVFTYMQFRDARRRSMNKDDSLAYAISVRLRPNLMTALGAVSALFPLALGIGTGAQMHQPLAIAIIGGFVIALPLLLFVLPTTLRYLEK
jgi:cobalt-zinc-cadmium resistance protein CzcA